MNFAVFKNKVILFGFLVTFLINGLTIYLAVQGNDYWVAVFVLGTIMLGFTIEKASKEYA